MHPKRLPTIKLFLWPYNRNRNNAYGIFILRSMSPTSKYPVKCRRIFTIKLYQLLLVSIERVCYVVLNLLAVRLHNNNCSSHVRTINTVS